MISSLTILFPVNPPTRFLRAYPQPEECGGGAGLGGTELRFYVPQIRLQKGFTRGSRMTHLGDLKCPQWVTARDPGTLQRHRQSMVLSNLPCPLMRVRIELPSVTIRPIRGTHDDPWIARSGSGENLATSEFHCFYCACARAKRSPMCNETNSVIYGNMGTSHKKYTFVHS